MTCLLLAVNSSAQNTSEDFTVSFGNGGLVVETYEGGDEHVVIPSHIAGHPVRHIADWAFSGKSILSVVIPGTIASVSEKAFYGCSDLEVIEYLGALPPEEQPFKGLSTTAPPTIRHWDNGIDKETATYRGLGLQAAWQVPLPIPVRMDHANGHLFEGSLTLSFPQTASGQILRYNENFHEPTVDSPLIANGATKTIFADCHLSLRVFSNDGTPLSGITHVTYGRLDKPQPLAARDFQLRLCTCQNESGRLEIEGVKTYAPVVRLPKELDGKPVFNLCTPQAWTCSTLAIILPDNIGQCGYSFANNRFLEYIHFSDGIHGLTNGIASGCGSLARIDLPQSIVSIGADAFSGCTSLTEVILPPGLAALGKRAFFDCQSLQSIVFPAMLQKIDEEAFANCTNLTEVIFCGPPPQTTGKVFPPSVASIKVQPNLGWGNEFDGIPVEVLDASLRILRTDGVDGNFFADKLEVKCEVMPPFVPMEYSLNGAPSIAYTKPFTITESTMVTVQAVVNGAQYGPAISRSFVKTDDDHARELFTEDKENGVWILRACLPYLALPQSLTTIDGLAREEGVLQSLYIPSTTSNLAGRLPMSGSQAVNPLAGAHTLKEIIVNQDNASFKVIDGALFDATATTLLSYPPARQGNVYKVPEGVQYIASEAFAYASNLETVILPDSLISIGKGAFHDMARLAKLDFPQNVREIPPDACRNCIGLTQVSLPFILENINRSAFEGCVSLGAVNLPPFLKVIGDYAFRNCGKLQYLDIPASIELVCISALFGVHDGCKVNFNGIYSYYLPFWGNGAQRDEETDEYLLPHLVVSWWNQYYAPWYLQSSYMWQCFEEDDDAYYELISLDCNNGHLEYYQYSDYYNAYSNFQFGYQISMMDGSDPLDGNLCRLDFNFDYQGAVYDNLILCYTLDGTEPNLYNGILEAASHSVTVYSDRWPFVFRARFFDHETGEQVQGEINCLIQEVSSGSDSCEYEIDYELLFITEMLNQKFISRGSLSKYCHNSYIRFFDTDEPMHGNLLYDIPQGESGIILRLPPYQEVFNIDDLTRIQGNPWKIELYWFVADDEIPKTIYMSEALCEADVDWSCDGDILNASLAEVNPVAGEYRIENEDGENGNLRVEDGVLFAGDMLVAYPGKKAGVSYDIPDGTASIACHAFCRNLTGYDPLKRVSIPASVNYIYSSAFSNANHLIDVSFTGKKPVNAKMLFDEDEWIDGEWCRIYPNAEGETCTVHAFPNCGFEEEYDRWQEELLEEEDYYWWRYWDYQELQTMYPDDDYYQWYDTFDDYLADYPCLFWNMGSLVIEGMPAPSFVVQEDGCLAIVMQEDGLETRGQYEIRYTMDGTQPTIGSPLYEGPIPKPAESCLIRAVVFHDGVPYSTLATYRVRRKHEDESSVCDDEWILQKDVLTEDGQPVLSPPAHGAFIYRHTEMFQDQGGYLVTFWWKLDSTLAAMSLKVDGQLVVERRGYTPWQSISVYMEDEEEHCFEWECDYRDDAKDGNPPFDVWLGRPVKTPLPGIHSITIQDDMVVGSYEAGTSVSLLPDLYPDKKLLKWEIVSRNAELIGNNMFVMPDDDVIVMPYYSQYTENAIRPGWNLLGNMWLFEDRNISANTQVFVFDSETRSYVAKNLAEASGNGAFWYYYDGMTKLVPDYGGVSRTPHDMTPGWHLLPGGMELPEGCSCFVFDKQSMTFRHQDTCDDPSAGYWIYVP